MSTLKIPCPTGQVSDGYHTFDELYEHRNTLFLCLLKLNGGWISKLHDDGTQLPGWFIAGTLINQKMVTYHMPEYMWGLAASHGATILDRAYRWDGHSPGDVLVRLRDFIATWS